MPASSQAQQKLMGAALAAKKGAKPISKKVAGIAKSMSTKELEKYAGTKHKGLPKKVNKEGAGDSITEMYAVQQPYSGCQPQDLVTPFNPIHGVPHDAMIPDVVHSVYPDMETATAIAESLCQEMIQYEGMIEEKKGTASGKISKMIDKLEKQRKEHVQAAKENPKQSSEHREKIAHLTAKIDDLMTKMERIEKSKKEIKKEKE